MGVEMTDDFRNGSDGLSRPFGMAPRSKGVIAIDPPWPFEHWGEPGPKSIEAQYHCMTLDEIAALPVRDLALPDCWLFLWATGPLLPVACDVMRGWGFTFVSPLTWRKVTKTGKQKMGLGRVLRTMSEFVLIGKIGEPPFRKAVGSILEAEMFDGVAREHSRKPEEFYQLVDEFALSELRADIFARTRRPGWESFGDELDKFEGAE